MTRTYSSTQPITEPTILLSEPLLSALSRPVSKTGLSILSAIALAFVIGGCSQQGDSAASGQGGEAPAAAKASLPTAIGGNSAEAASKKRPPSVRGKLDIYRPLLDEAARAEVDAGGLIIDLGTAEQHKYTRGGWRTGWGVNKLDGGVSIAEVRDRRAHLDVMLSAPAKEIAVRARSAVDKQAATVWVDGERQGDIWLKPEFTVMRLPVKEGALAAGRHSVQLTFSKKGTPRAEVDWVWLARTPESTPPSIGVRVLPLSIGGQPKRAFIAPTARTYSLYFIPPAKSSLVFDYASDAGAAFTVRIQTDGGEAEEVFAAEGEAVWNEKQIDLGRYTGQAIRVDLATTGSEGKSGWGEPAIMVPLPADEPASSRTAVSDARPKNVIMILIDTVRADVFEAFKAGNGIQTPAYDALAEKSTVFVNAFNNENWTKPSVATTLSGVYPSTHDTKKDESKLPDEVELISERLKKEGFATAGFVANGYVSEKFGFERGWDYFRNYIRENRKSDAEFVYRDALSWLNERRQDQSGKPYFLYIQTIDPHVTYKVPREYTKLYYNPEYGGPLGPSIDARELQDLSTGKRKGSEGDINWLRAVYHGEVTYHDEFMGKFLQEIETLGALEDTLIVVTNDHGEELQDHGKFGHGHSLFDELLRAPLLMHYPGLFPAGNHMAEAVENVDVTPTILDALGLDPMAAADGLSLLPLVQGKAVQRPYYAVSEFLDGRRAVHVGKWKLMRSSSTFINVFDMEKDPGELNDLSKEALIARRMCEVHLGEGLATPDKSKRQQDIIVRRQFKAGEADIDPVMRKQLEALGYFGE